MLVEAGAEVLLHLGDIESEKVLDEMVTVFPGGGVVPVQVVFGNVDWNAAELARYAEALGITVAHPVGSLMFDDRELVFLHGDDRRAMDAAVARGVAWVCFGHTHHPTDERCGATRLINPGALHRASTYTVALLDTTSDQLRFYSVPRE